MATIKQLLRNDKKEFRALLTEIFVALIIIEINRSKSLSIHNKEGKAKRVALFLYTTVSLSSNQRSLSNALNPALKVKVSLLIY